ncbi:DNA topoisomerase 3-alpha isoform X2 [Chelonus insularis]|nr:DNA topoisomerase 3-alpha isoform X2 [Chelonus insularis]
MMKVLNVAEKNDAAKNIAGLLSRGTSRKREGLSKFNKIYEFNFKLWNKDCLMIMTSVSGHLMGYEFVGAYRQWQGCSPLALFDAQVVKQCTDENYVKIKRTIEREVKACEALIIWTDCDREGENIGFEIIQVCQAVKPRLQIYRAVFSEITGASITRAINNLTEPNKALSDAVDVRSELDLRIGAAFTRFQTLRLQKVFPRSLAQLLISYGSCQFPTLGFVVERFLAIENFKSEPYWKIKVLDDHDGICVEFRWARGRLFEKLPCEIFLDICREKPEATVESVNSRPKSKWRPLPLDTIELEKQGSKKLRLNAKETMKIAEKLYTQGIISYPRTETNIFPKGMNLPRLVEQQINHNAWGGFAQRVLDEGVSPRQGKKSDQAHPPIHPTKYVDNLQGNEARVYEFIVRHFLACVSKNAEGYETTVEIDINGEKFTANGLQIIAKNYLEVYVYEKWNAKEIHIYQPRQVFQPTTIDMVEENTSPPNLLTEADLIALMDKHGIGTDATHAEHIETIKARQYVGLKDNQYFMPGKLGIGLVMGYDSMGFQMSKPNLRAELENDLKLICDSAKDPQLVLREQIDKYRNVFQVAMQRANLLDSAIAEYIDERPVGNVRLEEVMPVEEVGIFKCPKCGLNMTLKDRRQGGGKYIGCMGFPTCNNVIWLPQSVTEIEVTNEICSDCPGDMKKLKFKMRPNSFPIFGTSYEACIGGCDSVFNDMMNINLENVRRSNRDSGYSSTQSSLSSQNSRATQSSQPRPSGSTSNRGGSGGAYGGASGSSRGRGSGTSRGGASGGLGMVTSSNIRPSAPSTHGRGGNSSSRGQNNTKRSNDYWPEEFREPKRPKVVTRPVQNSDRENVNITNFNDSEFMCNCQEPAILLTVRKEGPNKGRQFYKCAKPQGSTCDFFLWAENSSDTQNSWGQSSDSNQWNSTPTSNSVPSRNNWNSNSSSNSVSARNNWNQGSMDNNPGSSNTSWNNDDDDQGGTMCTCGQPAKKLTVRKEGPNKGREFYACPQGPGSSCSFFEWADSGGSSNQSNNSNWGSSSRGGSSGRGRGRGSGAPRAASGKRKCGICGVEGHTKKTCPQNAMD